MDAAHALFHADSRPLLTYRPGPDTLGLGSSPDTVVTHERVEEPRQG